MSHLTPIANNLWSTPGVARMPGGIVFPCRMLIVRLSDGRLWLHSPVELSDAVVDAINDLGEVAFLVAPNKMHHLFLKDAMARFPNAEVYGAPGLADKRDDLRFDATIPASTPEAWRSDLDLMAIDGLPDLNEVVFLHKPSRTLIVTDLIFNMKTPHNWQTWLVHTLAGVRGRFAQSRLLRVMTRDRQAAGDSVARLLSQWEFERVVVAHGDVVEESAQAQVRDALSWMLGGSRRALPAPAA